MASAIGFVRDNLPLSRGQGEVKSFAALEFGHDAVAPELAYVTARYAALAPFGKVAELLHELLPISGAQNAGTVRRAVTFEVLLAQVSNDEGKQVVFASVPAEATSQIRQLRGVLQELTCAPPC